FYHEAYAVRELRSYFQRSHIVATDSTGSFTEASLAIPEGGRGFFDGYKHIILMMDPDSAGRRAADLIACLARRQGSRALIRDVDVSPYGDVSEFFDAGNTLVDLIQLINTTKPFRPQ
ncbi:MAG: toprim domain-containing protein, partial [Blastocatellia bacterium]